MALPYPLSSKVQADGTPFIGGMIHVLRELYTEGRPSHMTFSYIPVWKLHELESKIRTMVKPQQASHPAVTKSDDERAAEVDELERKAQVCRRGVTVSEVCEIKLLQGIGVLRGNILTLNDVTVVSDWVTLKGCHVYFSPMSG